MTERKDTGRVYLMNVDNVNSHGAFLEDVAPIRQSNLCCEIALPTKPLTNIYDEEGEISLCTLSAINWGNIKEPKDFERPCKLAVRALDELLDYQDYPVKAAYRSTMNRRPLGVGIINLAYWLAKNDFKYSDDSSLTKLDEYMEAMSYYLIKASVDLAMEKGACPKSNETKYAQGIMPIDSRKQDLDELVTYVERCDWDSLRAAAKAYGIRNSTLMALMPAETSAQIANATNGIEPPRSYISIKQSKHGVLKQVVPEFKKLRSKYELLWDQPSPEGYIKICAVLQKYIDQAISVNTSYNPQFYPDEKVPMSDMIRHTLLHYKLGGKTLYYFNTYDGQGEINIAKLMEDLPAELPSQEACDSCTI
jgi:ribonucleoside-diphosphate reductase alpha chain